MSINLKLVVLFSAFWCFLVLVKSYRKKKKKFQTDLITLYILLFKSHNFFSPLPSNRSAKCKRLGLLQSGYHRSNQHKRDPQITRSQISYSLIEPHPLPCTTACGYESHALAVHLNPTFTPTFLFFGFCSVPLVSH